MSTIVAFCAYAAAWVWFYWESFPDLIRRWNTDDYSYCWLVPAVALFMAFRTWRSRGTGASGVSPKSGYLLFIVSVFLFFLGKGAAVDTLVYGSMWLSVVAFLLLGFGWGTVRTYMFPLFILAFAIPPPPFINRLLTFKLRLVSSDIAVRMLHILDIPVYREGNVIDLGVIQLHVVDACSGLRYLFPTVFISLLAGYLLNPRVWQRTIVFLASVPTSIVTNAFRIAVVGVLAQKVSVETAKDFFHNVSGILIYVLSLGVLFALSLALNLFTRKANGESEFGAIPERIRLVDAKSGKKTKAHAVFAAILLGLAALGLLFADTARVIPPRADFESFPMQIGSWHGTRQYFERDVLESLGADDYVTAVYKNRETGRELYLLVSYYDYQEPMHAAHNPVSCLLGGGGWSLEEDVPATARTSNPFMVRRMTLDKPGERMLAAYWFQQRGRTITNEFLNKLYLALDGAVTRRTDGALIRVEMPLSEGEAPEQGFEIMEKFIDGLTRVLPRYVPGA